MLTAAAASIASNPQPNLPGFLNVVGTYLGHYGYWAILLLVMVEDFGIPVPGETILIAGAIYAGAGRLNVVAVGLVGFFAAVVGDNVGFAIGHFGGRALALRWGKYVFLTEERLDKAEAFFNRHGGKIIAVARFIEGLRQANGIIAGITGMRWLRFLAFNALGAALWVGTWVSIGYLTGNHITTIYNAITQYSYYVLIALVVLVVAYVVWRVRRRRRPKAVATETSRPPAEAVTAEASTAEASTAEASTAEASTAPVAADDIHAADGTQAADASPAGETPHASAREGHEGS